MQNMLFIQYLYLNFYIQNKVGLQYLFSVPKFVGRLPEMLSHLIIYFLKHPCAYAGFCIMTNAILKKRTRD